MSVLYNIVRHDLRKEWELTAIEYIILDLIHIWSHNIKYGGWCIASKVTIADTVGVSRRYVISTVQKLEEKGLVECDTIRHFIRSTDKTREKIGGEQTSHPVQNSKIKENKDREGCEQTSQGGVNKLHTKCEQTSHNNIEITISDNKEMNERMNKPPAFFSLPKNFIGNTLTGNTLKTAIVSCLHMADTDASGLLYVDKFIQTVSSNGGTTEMQLYVDRVQAYNTYKKHTNTNKHSEVGTFIRAIKKTDWVAKVKELAKTDGTIHAPVLANIMTPEGQLYMERMQERRKTQ